MIKKEDTNSGTNADMLVKALGLTPLEGEGGMYRLCCEGPVLSDGRKAFSSIYYLLTDTSFSHMHKLATDEVYHFYMGDSLEILLLYLDGRAECKVLGTRISEGEVPQLLVPAGVWQGARVAEGGTCSLVGTTMAPAYRNEDYEHGDCRELCKRYPEAEKKIKERCKEGKAL